MLTMGQVKLVVAVTAASGVGYLGANVMPVMNSAVMDGTPFDEQGVGLLGSLELTSVAVGTLLVARWIAGISRFKLAMTGAAVAGCGFLMSASSEAFAALAIGRVVTGLGGGIALAAGNAAVAATRDPDRTFALVFLVGGAVAAALISGLPLVIGPWGYPGAFAVLAGVCLVAMPFFGWLPPSPSADETAATSSAAINPAVLLTLGAVLTYSISEQALWAFAAEIGVEAGLDLETVGPVVGATVLAGLLGSALASWLGTRVGRTVPLVAGFTLDAVARWCVTHASTPLEYTAMAILWGLTFFFLLPYLLGTAAALDPGGRWTVVAGAMSMLGYALGPAVGGFTVANWGYSTLAVFVVGCSLAGFALILAVALPLDRAARLAAARSQAPE